MELGDGFCNRWMWWGGDYGVRGEGEGEVVELPSIEEGRLSMLNLGIKIIIFFSKFER